MSVRRIYLLFIPLIVIIHSSFSQVNANQEDRILFHGIVMDANTLSPISNSQILINHLFSAVSAVDGTFAFYVFRKDSVLFKHLGYKSTFMIVSDTLKSREFIAGVYMHSDTVVIGEVIIVPRFNNLRSEILNSPSKVPSTMENARYNVAISAYQGRTTQGKLGDPAANYDLIRDRQKVQAFEKGGIPTDKIAGINPLLILPGAYLLIHGLPEKPPQFEQKLTDQEIDELHELYLESLEHKK
jgi:hypothetical protein